MLKIIKDGNYNLFYCNFNKRNKKKSTNPDVFFFAWFDQIIFGSMELSDMAPDRPLF